MTETSTLKDKIQKCLALSKDAGATEAERNAAIAKAMALCTKYNLDFDEVNKASDNELANMVERNPDPRPAHAWLKTLIGPISRVNMCSALMGHVDHGGKWQPLFLGEEHNVQFCEWLYYYLYDSITREARLAARGVTHKKSGFIRSFENGAARKVAERLNDMAYDMKQGMFVEIEGGEKKHLPALANMWMVKMDAAQEFLHENHKNLKRSSVRTSSSNASGYDQGKAFGGRVNLTRPVGGASTKQINR